MKLLLATYNLPPEAYGGTEVYLEGLTAELAGRGHRLELLAGSREEYRGPERLHLNEGTCWGFPAWRMAMNNSRVTMADIYTTRAPELRAFWVEWLARHRPDLLHVNAHTLAISHSLLEAAADLGIPIVYTLHNAVLLCPRGDFLMWNGEICDGRAELMKCVHCNAATRGGVAAGLAMSAVTPLLSHLPVPDSAGWPAWRSALHYPALLRMYFESRRSIVHIPARWHVFSEWSRNALVMNGAPKDRIVLLRHSGPSPATAPRVPAEGVLRLGFFGRFNKVKGVPVLLDAIRSRPDLKLRLDLYGRAQDSSEAPIENQVRAAASADSRIVWHGQIAKSEQAAALAQLDVMVVPSMWIETGPLTVLEAFAAKLPVLGSDLSGINEWVKPGENGWLFPHGNSAALAGAIARLCADSSLVAKANRFPKLDSMAEHAQSVEKIYDAVLAETRGAPVRGGRWQEVRA